MVFNSLKFFCFLAIVYSLYLSLNHRRQNYLLLIASYVFYGFWDWRFLFLIFLSTVVDYVMGIKIDGTDQARRRKLFIILSICINLSILGFFKYFNFFSDNLILLADKLGFTLHPMTLRIILPVGVSFYTFQSMSYTIDIYRRTIKPTRNFVDFALFVSFFPQLVAGPIERASHLLPQFLKPRKVTLDDFYQGSFLIFWGLFQKVFVADNLAKIVDPVFAPGALYDGQLVLWAVYAFAFQVFCDFAGYSNMARGIAQIMGFDLMVNFNLPYFSTNPAEFWRRWHISLSTWLRDYLYIPLGGNRKGQLATYRNLMLTMLLGGLWHGASWTFVMWGAYHGALLIIYRLVPSFIKITHAWVLRLWRIIQMIFFFHLVCFGWLLFRANSFSQVGDMLNALFYDFNTHLYKDTFLAFLGTIFLLAVVETVQYLKNDLMAPYKWPLIPKAAFYTICFYLLLLFGVEGGKEFIYFQF